MLRRVRAFSVVVYRSFVDRFDIIFGKSPPPLIVNASVPFVARRETRDEKRRERKATATADDP